jgi:Zn-finger nucleic acid-binding protein
VTDVYRTSPFTCPVCTTSSLREYQDRLVCDECNGMLIDTEDLRMSVGEIDGSSDTLELVDEQRSASTACPQCHHPMSWCALQLGDMKIDGTFLRCDRDGVWFPRDAMTALFARVSRRGGFRGLGAVGRAPASRSTGGNRNPATSFVANMPSADSGMSAAMASIQFGAGGPASGALAIGQRQSRRPRVHALFVSAHKDRRLGCPSCKEAELHYQGERWECAACAGTFVETAALTAMIEEMSQQPWDAPAVYGAPGDRACPICSTAMVVEVLEAVTVDRCSTHGVWFDDTELQAALHHASSGAGGIGAWLKRLFHRHGSTK